jgi:TonB family protein
MATQQLFGTEPAGSNIAASFGAASAVVIAGVLAAWIFVKHAPMATPDASLDREVQIAAPDGNIERSPAVNRPASNSLLEQAEIAFAAGRIIEPEFDNALNYYRSLLETEPDNKDAAQGVERVVAYLENQAEGAIFQNDWDAARAYTAVILNVRPEDGHARELRARINKLERVQVLTAKALDQSARGNLVTPKDDNAADSYRAIVALDPDNSVAAQGMRSIVQRLVANAQSAAFAGEQDKAQKFAAAARAIDPEAPGLAEFDKPSKQTKRTGDDHGVQSDLLAASEALQADRLMPPATPNAFDLFNAVLAREPQSAAAQRGLTLVREALLDRVGSLIAGGSLDQAGALLVQAKVAGADDTRLGQLQRELAYQNRLKDAREGRFDRLYSVSELKITKQVAPLYPRGARANGLGGWVELEFTVTEQGDVRDAKARDSSASIFEGAAMSAINRWRFAPVIDDGRPVPVRGVVRFTFKGENG